MLGWIVGAAIAGFGRELAQAPGRALQERFIALGTLKGKTLQEIESAVGAPCSISAAGGNGVLYQWMATGYHIALLFRESACEGVTHEFSSSNSVGKTAEAPPDLRRALAVLGGAIIAGLIVVAILSIAARHG